MYHVEKLSNQFLFKFSKNLIGFVVFNINTDSMKKNMVFI